MDSQSKPPNNNKKQKILNKIYKQNDLMSKRHNKIGKHNELTDKKLTRLVNRKRQLKPTQSVN